MTFCVFTENVSFLFTYAKLKSNPNNSLNMFLFSSASPFDPDVEKVTNEKSTDEEWGPIMDICDRAGTSTQSAKDCLRSILKRLGHNDPHVALKACTLLGACVNNCGRVFHLEVASRDFEQEYRKLITKVHPGVKDKLKEMLQEWAEGDFKTDAQLSLIPGLYKSLRTAGLDFTPRSEPKSRQTPLNKDPNAVTSQEEEDDIVKAITLSLKDVSTKQQPTSSSLYPSTSGASAGSIHSTVSHATEARKVRALYDFEAAEDNELTFKAGELIHVLDDSDANWWTGYNKRGEGLFPSNFVTADLSAEPESFKSEQPKKSVQFNDAVTVKVVQKEAVEINEEKIDRLLHLLHEANPEEDHSDTTEMLDLEEQVNAMGPLIDAELERVDRKHAQLTQLSADLVDALNLYHTLMREPQTTPSYQGLPKGPPYGYQAVPQAPINLYNGAHHGALQYNLPPEQYGMQGPPGGPNSLPPMPPFMNRGSSAGPESLPAGPMQYAQAMYPGSMVGYGVPNTHPQFIPQGSSGSGPQGPQGPQGPPQGQAMAQPPPPGTFSPPSQQLL